MQTKELVTYLDSLLEINKIPDDSLNGLQVDNCGEVAHIGIAVDASKSAFKKASDLGVDFLIVHHGLFWEKRLPITGILYDRIKILVQSNVALYAAHLPLDCHPKFGNNACIEKIMDWPVVSEFGEYNGVKIGREIVFKNPVSLDTIVNKLREKLDSQLHVWDFGPEKITRLGYVSGGGLSILPQAILNGMDAFITGEPKHSAYWDAKEAGIHVIFAGHYATETLGIQALGKHIKEKWRLPVTFIDLPTGF